MRITRKKSWRDYNTCEEYANDLKQRKLRKIYRRRRIAVALFVCVIMSTLISTVVFARTADDISDYVPVAVEPGDTLWRLAGKYYPDMARRDAIDEIRAVNGLTGSTIYVGDVLLMPDK